jgi:site-specific DNA-cytosine methylase
MMTYKTGFVVPLIGGMAIAQANVFGKPNFIQSFKAFAKNDQHLRAYWPDVPFQVLDEDNVDLFVKLDENLLQDLDVVGTLCPCAGLSSLSPVSSADSAVNDWMYQVSEHVLSTLHPKVFWGENAPALSSEKGRSVALRLQAIGRKNGYTFSLYRTKSELHDNPQVRQRTYFFFWRTDKKEVPMLSWVSKSKTIEDFFKEKYRKNKYSKIYLRDDKPSDLPIYRYILDRFGVDHVTFVRDNIKDMTIMSQYLMKSGFIDDIIAYLDKNNLDRDATRVRFWKKKLDMGTGVMDRYLLLPKDHIGAFVGQLPWSLAHPFEDRFLNVQEMMRLMYMPDDFTFIDPKRNINHLCQNTPVRTSHDVALMIKDYLDGRCTMMPVGNDMPIFDNMSQHIMGVTSSKPRMLF